MRPQGSVERHFGMLRAWQLAILRFAVTLDNADRLAVLMIASEIDRPDPRRDRNPDFRFFRKTSAELCAAILRPNELAAAILRQYLARIDDDRLRRVFAAAIDADQPPVSPASKPAELGSGLWRGLSSRGDHQLS